MEYTQCQGTTSPKRRRFMKSVIDETGKMYILVGMVMVILVNPDQGIIMI